MTVLHRSAVLPRSPVGDAKGYHGSGTMGRRRWLAGVFWDVWRCGGCGQVAIHRNGRQVALRGVS